MWNRFTSGGNSEFPVWTLDGTRVVYNSDRSGAVAIEMKRSDGSGAVETLVSGQWARRSFPFSWSPDGLLAFVAVRPAQDIFTVKPGSGADPAPFVATPFVEGGPTFAPDGRAIAYVSAETGRNRDLCTNISWRWREGDRLQFRRQRAGVVADRPRAVLPRRRRHDGR